VPHELGAVTPQAAGIAVFPEKNPGAPRGDYFETLADAAQMSLKERAAFMIRPDTYWV